MLLRGTFRYGTVGVVAGQMMMTKYSTLCVVIGQMMMAKYSTVGIVVGQMMAMLQIRRVS